MSTEPHAQSMEMKMKLDSRENHCNEGAKDLCDQNGVNVKIDDSNSVQNQATVSDLSENSYEQANRWSELKFQVTKLMEENLSSSRVGKEKHPKESGQQGYQYVVNRPHTCAMISTPELCL
ncbi:hypothetical protein GH714_029426 [Hevea brasiliensis]|uniref:Uncharacterized protein n=1 Tax=Hevea brasiliensis TaxID=3981 RepID=A0A6A6LK55_HEVBR|nr:hypothetical protein GH714_029426 [Hevea brasiliensis]